MRSERILIAFIVGLVCGSGTGTHAFAAGGDRIPGSRYVSGRGAALGDAYIGLADGLADSMFYNPAAVAKLKGFNLEPLNFQIQANKDLVGKFGTEWYKFSSLSGYKGELTSDPRAFPGGSLTVVPAFGFPGFAAGLMYSANLAAVSPDGTNIRYRSRYQLIPTVATGISLASGVLRLGYSLQWVNQASGDRTVASTADPLGYDQGIQQGSGFSHNFGLSLTLPYIYQPSVHVVARNIAGLSLSGKNIMSLAKNANGNPPEQEMSLDAAFGLVTKLGKGIDVNWVFNYRDFTDSSKTARLAHLSLGMEIAANDFFFLRAGYGSGYPSAGAGVKTRHGEMNLAWFSEEVGAGLRSERDIRYVFQYILRVF